MWKCACGLLCARNDLVWSAWTLCIISNSWMSKRESLLPKHYDTSVSLWLLPWSKGRPGTFVIYLTHLPPRGRFVPACSWYDWANASYRFVTHRIIWNSILMHHFLNIWALSKHLFINTKKNLKNGRTTSFLQRGESCSNSIKTSVKLCGS